MTDFNNISETGGESEEVSGSDFDIEYYEDRERALYFGYSNQDADLYAQHERIAREQAMDQWDNQRDTAINETQRSFSTDLRGISNSVTPVDRISPTIDTPLSIYPSLEDETLQGMNDLDDSPSLPQTLPNPYGYEQPPPELYKPLPRDPESSYQDANPGIRHNQNEDAPAHNTNETDSAWFSFNVSLPNSTQIMTLQQPQTPTRTFQEPSQITYDPLPAQRSSLPITSPQQTHIPTTGVPHQPLYVPSAPSADRHEAYLNVLTNINQTQEARRRHRSSIPTNTPLPPTTHIPGYNSRQIPSHTAANTTITTRTAPNLDRSRPQISLNTPNTYITPPQPAQISSPSATPASNPPSDPSQAYITSLPNTYAGRRTKEARDTYPFECEECKKRYCYFNSAQKHYRSNHGPNPRIVERWENAPRRPPPATPRNAAAVQARGRGRPRSGGGEGSDGMGNTMTSQRALPAFTAYTANATATITPTPRVRAATTLLPAPPIRSQPTLPPPLPPFPPGVSDEDRASLTWVARFGQWYRRSRIAGESDEWEYWNERAGMWMRW